MKMGRPVFSVERYSLPPLIHAIDLPAIELPQAATLRLNRDPHTRALPIPLKQTGTLVLIVVRSGYQPTSVGTTGCPTARHTLAGLLVARFHSASGRASHSDQGFVKAARVLAAGNSISRAVTDLRDAWRASDRTETR